MKINALMCLVLTLPVVTQVRFREVTAKWINNPIIESFYLPCYPVVDLSPRLIAQVYLSELKQFFKSSEIRTSAISLLPAKRYECPSPNRPCRPKPAR